MVKIGVRLVGAVFEGSGADGMPVFAPAEKHRPRLYVMAFESLIGDMYGMVAAAPLPLELALTQVSTWLPLN